MAEFTVNPTRFDPYQNFKFRIKWDGQYVAGLSKMTPLKRTTEVVKHREAGDPSTSIFRQFPPGSLFRQALGATGLSRFAFPRSTTAVGASNSAVSGKRS